MIISYSHKFVFIHLEKCGGTTVEHSLAPTLNPGDLLINDWTRIFFDKQNYQLSEHSPAWVAKKWIGSPWNNLRKFSVVRDPVDIMRSMYSYSKGVYDGMYKNTFHVPEDGSLKAIVYSEKTGYGPDGFVDYMFTRGYHCISPQADRLEGIIKNDWIIDLTELDNEWNNITDWLGLGELPMLRKNLSNSNLIEFSSDTVKSIKKNFEKDYDIFPDITGVRWN